MLHAPTAIAKALALSLALAGAAHAQTVPPVGQASAAPFKNATAIVLHLPDSAKTVYAAVTRNLLAAGYGIDKSDKDALFLSTTAKSFDAHTFVKLQVVALPAAAGTDVVLRGTWTWLSAATIMAHIGNRELPVQFAGGPNTPAMNVWRQLQAAATAAGPSAQVAYK